MDNINSASFGLNLRKYRKWREYTQQALASECGLSDKYISDLESSRKTPSYEAVKKFASVLNVSLEQLSYDISTPGTDDYFVNEALMLRKRMSDKQKKLADHLGLKLLEEILDYPEE